LPELDVHSIGGPRDSSRKEAKKEDIKTVVGWKSYVVDT
jgi:hypothetical protein